LHCGERGIDGGTRGIEVCYRANFTSYFAHSYPMVKEASQKCTAGQPRFNGIEKHHVGFWFGGAHPYSNDTLEAVSQILCVCMVLRQALDMVIKGIQAARSSNSGLPHGTAENMLLPTRFCDEAAATGQDRADGGAQPLREINPETVDLLPKLRR
jgi:hypothetical protein